MEALPGEFQVVLPKEQVAHVGHITEHRVVREQVRVEKRPTVLQIHQLRGGLRVATMLSYTTRVMRKCGFSNGSTRYRRSSSNLNAVRVEIFETEQSALHALRVRVVQ